MLQKQVLLVLGCGVAVTSLFLSSGCGEQKTKSTAKTGKAVTTVKSGKVKTKIVTTPTNMVINPSVEEGKAFNSGLEKPVGWTTKGQFLDDSSGWVSNEAHSGKRSLKIENIGGTDAYWEGKPIILKNPANSFKASIWTKAKGIGDDAGKGKFQLAFAIYFRNAEGKEVWGKKIFVNIPKNGNVWRKTSKEIFLVEKISRIVPYLHFSGMTGTAWFDDLSIMPYLDKGKVLFDGNMKDSFAGKIKNILGVNKKKIYEMAGSETVVSSNFIPVDKNVLYELSGEFKSSGKEKSKLLFGYISYDKNKKIIKREYVSYIRNTETELAKNCDVEDKVIYLKDAIAWKSGSNMCMAFEIDDSGKFNDLPNSKLSGKGIKRISKHGNLWKVELLKSCGVKYVKGTKVREHVTGATYNYLMGTDSMDNVWTKYMARFSYSKMYPCTKYLKVLLLNHSGRQSDRTDFKNIKLIEYKIN